MGNFLAQQPLENQHHLIREILEQLASVERQLEEERYLDTETNNAVSVPLVRRHHRRG